MEKLTRALDLGLRAKDLHPNTTLISILPSCPKLEPTKTPLQAIEANRGVLRVPAAARPPPHGNLPVFSEPSLYVRL